MKEFIRQRIIFSVINDLVTDQRLHRICSSLSKAGYNVTLIGRKLKNGPPLYERTYRTRRIRFLFNRSFLFYAEYNIRLFFILLFGKADIFVANDLDTLPANFFASIIRRKKLVYDSHEYFTEMPELEGRRYTKKVWLTIEKAILPKIKYSYTVCDSLARIYIEKYNINMKVVRNLPMAIPAEEAVNNSKGKNQPVIIYQGALNKGRGLEPLIKAMQYIDNAELHIIGDGDIAIKLKELASQLSLTEKVIFKGRLPFEALPELTRKAWIGISIEETVGLNYYYSLPNKLFDYIQAKVPVLTSGHPEMRSIVEGENIGMIIENHEPQHIASKLKIMLTDSSLQEIWKKNLETASKKYCWENEKVKLFEIY
ncbi:MAG: glycosyltransferase [Bacteroidia bacterium]|nr:glycosyltransferase [Bacteroidia bacterium]